MSILNSYVDSIYAVYESSNYMEYGEFKNFIESASYKSEYVKEFEWVTIVPYHAQEYFLNHTSDLSYPSSLQTYIDGKLQSEFPTTAGEYHYFVSYVYPLNETHPETSSSFGSSLSSDENSIVENAITDLSSSNVSSSFCYVDSSDGTLELLRLLLKTSDVNDSCIPKENQNGVVVAKIRIESFFENIFFNSEINYEYSINSFTSRITSSDSKNSDDFCDHGSYEQKLDFFSGYSIDLVMCKTSSFFNSPDKVVKYQYLYIPALGYCFFVFALLVLTGIIMVLIRSRFRSKFLAKIVNDVVFLDFETLVIKEVLESKSRQNKNLRILVAQVKDFCKFLPQTLKNRIRENKEKSVLRKIEKKQNSIVRKSISSIHRTVRSFTSSTSTSIKSTPKDGKKHQKNGKKKIHPMLHAPSHQNAHSSNSSINSISGTGTGTGTGTGQFSDDEEDNPSERSASSNNSSGGYDNRMHHYQSSSSSATNSSSRKTGSSGISGRRNISKIDAEDDYNIGGLKERDGYVVTIVFENIETILQNFNNVGNLKGFQERYEKIIGMIMLFCNLANGDFHHSSVKEIVIHFGLVRRRMSPSTEILKMVDKIRNHVFVHRMRLRVNIGIAFGRVIHGYISPNNETTQFDIFGKAVLVSAKLARMCSRYDDLHANEVTILMNEGFAEVAKFDVDRKIVDVVQFQNEKERSNMSNDGDIFNNNHHHHKRKSLNEHVMMLKKNPPERIYFAAKIKYSSQNEWLYELQQKSGVLSVCCDFLYEIYSMFLNHLQQEMEGKQLKQNQQKQEDEESKNQTKKEDSEENILVLGASTKEKEGIVGEIEKRIETFLERITKEMVVERRKTEENDERSSNFEPISFFVPFRKTLQRYKEFTKEKKSEDTIFSYYRVSGLL